MQKIDKYSGIIFSISFTLIYIIREKPNFEDITLFKIVFFVICFSVCSYLFPKTNKYFGKKLYSLYKKIKNK